MSAVDGQGSATAATVAASVATDRGERLRSPRRDGRADPNAAEEAARARAATRGRMLGLALVAAVVAVAFVPAGSLRVGFAAVVTFGLVLLGLSSRPRKASPGSPVLRPASSAPWLQVAWTVFLVGFATRQDAVVLLGSALIVAVLGSALLGRASILRVRLARDLPARAQAGKPLEARWRVTSDGAAVPPVLVRDVLGAGARPAVVEAAFDGGDDATTTVVFERRGLRRLRPATISTRHPLGAFETSMETVAPAEVLVRPREGRVTRALLSRLTGASATAERLVAARPGTDHLYGLRDYRDGDDPRRIHWRTTARRRVRTLVEWREEHAKRVVVALARGARHVPDADVERAVSVAATVLRACARAGIRARLVRGDDEPPLEVGSRGGLERSLDVLALLRWSGGKRPASWLARGVRGRDGSTVVWVGTGDDPEARAAESASGGAVVHLRVDDPVALRRYVRGLP